MVNSSKISVRVPVYSGGRVAYRECFDDERWGNILLDSVSEDVGMSFRLSKMNLCKIYDALYINKSNSGRFENKSIVKNNEKGMKMYLQYKIRTTQNEVFLTHKTY